MFYFWQKREQIFNDYMREKYKTAKEDFRKLLMETKLITHKYVFVVLAKFTVVNHQEYFSLLEICNETLIQFCKIQLWIKKHRAVENQFKILSWCNLYFVKTINTSQ